MTIDISNNAARVNYTVASGVTQTSFAVPFEFFNDSDLSVYVADVLKTITTDYTVSGGDGSTGTVTISVTGASGGTSVVISRSIAIERTSDFVTGVDINRAALNTQLDTLTAIAADNKDKAGRSISAPNSEVNPQLELPDVDTRKGKLVGFNATTGDVELSATIADVNTLAAISGDIATLADIEDGTDATDAIQTVANDIANVNLVGTDITSVNTNATNITDIQNASANAATATTQAGIATTKASEASASEIAAEAAKVAAEAALDEFTDIYLGAKASDPTTDNDGDALTAGDQYFNTTINVLKIYNGSSWQTAAISSSGDASGITYDQGGTGAQERTVKSKLQETVSVKDFGAVGNGVTDDTSAFTSAATAAGVKAVYVPAGSYKIAGSVTSGSFFTAGTVTIVDGSVNVLDVSKPNTPKAHHSLSVINASQAALQRFNLTTQGTGSGNVVQGFAQDPYTNELFTLHVTGDPDTCVLNKFEADGKRAQTSYRYNSTPLTTLGHQELEISWDKDGARWFWTGENEAVTNQARFIKRFQIADGSGAELTVSNVQQFQVFTDAETTGVETGSASTCISLDGRYLVTEYSGSDTNLVKVFETATLMNGGAGDYSTQQTYSWTFNLDTGDYPLQSTACDGSYVYIFTGNIATGNTLKVFVYTVTGEFVEEIDDFTVGETEAQGDGAGTAYELEGAGWIWHGGQPMLACSIASGDSGSRVNRIWVLGAKVSVTAYGEGNKPAFISQGLNDLAVPDGEQLRLGHYNGATDTFTEGAKINASNQLEFTPVTGTWTASIFDSSSGGNASSTTDTAQYSKIGNMVWLNMSFSNVSISGMTSGNNFYIRGHGFTPTESAVFGTPVVSDFNLQAGDFNVVAEIGTDGNITFREIQDSATNTIANVSQINGADIRISGWFKV